MQIRAKNISFSYTEGKKILDNISFELEEEITAIVGVSGSGKSTLLKLLSGSLDSKGTLTINSISPKQHTQKGKVGYMFQERTLFPNLTVLNNVTLPLELRGVKSTTKAINLLERVGLGDYLDYLPSQLSGGMKTRVELARTFVTNPELILMDEPFGDLDVRWKSTLYKELETLRKEFGASLIWVTHDINEALLLSNRILVIGSNKQLLDDIKITKPLPRVFDDQAIFSMEKEYTQIREIIMSE